MSQLLIHRRDFKATSHFIGIFLIFIFQHTVAQIQHPGLVNYSIREGLPSTEVYEVFQDSQGFIWFATDHGVVKFDGYEMKVITVKDGLTDPVVFGITEDEQQRIWFRTYSGKLSLVENDKIKPYKWNNQLEELVRNNLMYCLYSHGNELQFSTERFIGKIKSDGKIEKEEIKKNELHIKITPDKKLLYGFYGSSRYLKKIKINNQYYPVELSDTINHNKVISGLQDGDNTIITINTDIFLYNGTSIKKVFTGRSSIISLSKDKEGFYWVGYTNHGVDKLKVENFTLVDQTPILPDKSITKVFQDHEGGMWFSTLEDGVYYTSNLKTITIQLKDKTRFATFNSNYAVVGDQKGKVSAFDLKNGNLVWERNFGAPVRSLFIDIKNQLWISAIKTSIVSLEKGILIKEVSGSYTGFSTQSDTTVLAVGGLRISRSNLNGNSDYILSNSIHLKILYDKPIIYTTGRTGLEILDSNLNVLKRPEVLSNSKITSILPIDDNQIFIGTIGNGFHLINNKDFSINSFNTDKNLIANDIYYAQKKDSLIWISTEKGMLSLKHQLLKNNHIQFYKTVSDEIPYERINFFHVKDDAIWAVTDYGIKIIPIAKKPYNAKPLFYYQLMRPQLTSINQKIEIDNKGSIQLKFGFISFSNQNFYTRYRISKDVDWTETSSRIINLQSISPGTYLLNIEFSLDKENWKTGTTLSFVVKPLWWDTWYVRLIIGLIVLLMGIFIYRRRIARYKQTNNYLGLINEQQKKLLEAEIEATERERGRIAKDLHDGIGMDLVSIKLMANQLAKKTDDEGALEIQSQLQKTIAEIQNIIYGLAPSGLKLFGLSHGLENYISMVRKNHTSSIILDYTGEEVKDEQIGAMVFRIIQELVTNSIKHSECNTISIHIHVSVSSITIDYNDNGVGFDLGNVRPGLGLSNIRSRVESLSGQINVESDFSGTNYSIKLPPSK